MWRHVDVQLADVAVVVAIRTYVLSRNAETGRSDRNGSQNVTPVTARRKCATSTPDCLIAPRAQRRFRRTGGPRSCFFRPDDARSSISIPASHAVLCRFVPGVLESHVPPHWRNITSSCEMLYAVSEKHDYVIYAVYEIYDYAIYLL